MAKSKKGTKESRLGIGLILAVAGGIAAYFLLKKPTIPPLDKITQEDLVLLAKDLTRVEFEKLLTEMPPKQLYEATKGMTAEESNIIFYTPEELKTGVLPPDKADPIVEYLRKVDAISPDEIRWWLRDVRKPGVWEELEAKTYEMFGEAIGAGEMREYARRLQQEANKEEAIDRGIYDESKPWQLALEMQKVEDAKAAGIPTEGRPRNDIIADLEATTTGATTTAAWMYI